MSFINNQLAIQGAIRNQHYEDKIIGGLIVPGSWEPKYGTAQVAILATIGIELDTGDAPTVVVAHEMNSYGDQTAPRGNERVHLHRTDEGWGFTYIHWDDDSPQSPAGEKRYSHYNANGVIDAQISFTNDGSVSGDGKAGVSITLAELITLATANGIKVIADDNAGTLSLGSSGLTANSNGVVRKEDLQMAANAIISSVNTAIATLCTRLQSGSGVAPSMASNVMASASTVVLSE